MLTNLYEEVIDEGHRKTVKDTERQYRTQNCSEGHKIAAKDMNDNIERRRIDE
jgi:hypothetical protein